MRPIAAVILALLLTGCAQHWTRPGFNQQVFNQHVARCKMMTPGGFWIGYVGLAIHEAQKKEFVENCLIAIGYQKITEEEATRLNAKAKAPLKVTECPHDNWVNSGCKAGEPLRATAANPLTGTWTSEWRYLGSGGHPISGTLVLTLVQAGETVTGSYDWSYQGVSNTKASVEGRVTGADLVLRIAESANGEIKLKRNNRLMGGHLREGYQVRQHS